MKCLKELKEALYSSTNPILYPLPGNSPDEATFLSMYFPKDFYTRTFVFQGKNITLAPILTKRGKDSSQRNSVFNGDYSRNALEDRTFLILRNYPELWNSLYSNCRDELQKAQDPSRFREYLKKELRSFPQGQFRHFVAERIESAPELALAAVILYLLLQGRIERFMELLQQTQTYESQFRYMDAAEQMLKRTLHPLRGKYATDPEFQKYYDGYAELLGPVTTLRENGNVVAYDHLLSTLYEKLISEDSTKLLHISGPGGAEKNAITQLLYLRMASDVKIGAIDNLAPCYINLGYYRGRYESSEDAKAKLTEDLQEFWNYTKIHQERKPVVFIDGIKNYQIDDFEPDYYLSECLRNNIPTAKIVIATESAVVMNRFRQRVLPPFATGQFLLEASMDSLNLLNREQSRRYFMAFSKLYQEPRTNVIYDRLRAFGFAYVDTYQIRLLQPALETASTISELYESVCKGFLGGSNQSELDTITNWTYAFAYTDQELEPISVNLKNLITAHDSFQDYFLARWYVQKLRNGTARDNISDLDMVLPKGVTRFITPMLSSDASLESLLVSFIEQNYSQMTLLAKSQMNYWLGRIRSPRIADRAEALLERNYKEVQPDIMDSDADEDPEYTQKLFLMRGITISLIVKGYQDYSDAYIELLLHNSVANEINRGFHLEYYGDKDYLPTTRGALDLMDNITIGKNTLDRLLAATGTCLDNGAIDPLFDLNLFTICSLLQARVEDSNDDVEFDIYPYLEQTCRQINAYLSPGFVDSNELFVHYLHMVKRDFESRLQSRKKPWSNIGADSYGVYSKRVARTGWKERGIPNPESVAEHTYSMWLIGTMLLQDSYPHLSGYSKRDVLSMIMIHDLAETVTGDIVTPEKEKNKKHYDDLENREMHILLLRESYPNQPCQKANVDLWKQWHSKENINARIAKEIDKIQLMYKALCYGLEYPEIMTVAEIASFMRSRKSITTMPGKKIYNTLIKNNEQFSELLEKVEKHTEK